VLSWWAGDASLGGVLGQARALRLLAFGSAVYSILG